MEKTVYKLGKRNQVLVFELKALELGNGWALISRKGQLGGTFQEDILPIAPKNVGRANETTPQQQAELELISKVNKLRDKGYKEIPGDDLSNLTHKLKALQGTDANNRKLPMLAQKNVNRITYPGYVQRKYDGMRGILFRENGELKIRSRNGKILDNLGHILEEALDLPEGWELDGELYAHGYKLQDIVSMTKREQPDNIKIKYRVYDILMGDTPFKERTKLLKDWCDVSPYGKYIVRVPTYYMVDAAQLYSAFNRYLEEGYEGAMWRDPEGVYESGQRSWGLIKVKDFDEGEFEIVDVEEATGRDEGTAIFICVTDKEVEFNVRPMGTREQRREYLENFDDYVGKLLTVRHQGWTKEGKPFHARGVIIRDYE